MHKLKLSFFTLLIFSTALSFGADEFENGVPQDLIEAFTNGQIYSDLPDDFPPIELPDSVTVMGSLVNEYNMTVVFDVSGGVDSAAQALARSFTNAGWTQLLPYEYEAPQNGFIYADAAAPSFLQNQQYCHDRYGNVTINSSGRNGGNIVTVNLSNRAVFQPGSSCRDQNQQRQMQRDRGGLFPFNSPNSQYLPRLVMPDDASSVSRTPFSGIGGFSSSGNDIETRANYSGGLDLEALYDHFAEQLEAQGWQPDSEWSGEVSSGGNWTYSPTDDRHLIGILTILNRSDDVMELTFRLLSGSAGGARIGAYDIVR